VRADHRCRDRQPARDSEHASKSGPVRHWHRSIVADGYTDESADSRSERPIADTTLRPFVRLVLGWWTGTLEPPVPQTM